MRCVPEPGLHSQLSPRTRRREDEKCPLRSRERERGGGRERKKEENPRQIRETEGKEGCKTARKIFS